jgi:hypothetical protein
MIDMYINYEHHRLNLITMLFVVGTIFKVVWYAYDYFVTDLLENLKCFALICDNLVNQAQSIKQIKKLLVLLIILKFYVIQNGCASLKNGEFHTCITP